MGRKGEKMKDEERYEVDFVVQDLLDNMHLNALRLAESTHSLMQCNDGTRSFFELIVKTAKAIGADGNTLRRQTYDERKNEKKN